MRHECLIFHWPLNPKSCSFPGVLVRTLLNFLSRVFLVAAPARARVLVGSSVNFLTNLFRLPVGQPFVKFLTRGFLFLVTAPALCAAT